MIGGDCLTDNDAVSVADMQAYLNLDSDEDADVLQSLIDVAEIDIQGSIDDNIELEKYREYKLFNQAVKTLVDFTYYNRGNLGEQKIAYPPSYQYMINGIRWKIRGAYSANSSSATMQSS
ncbi:hypothetical protein FD16_GL001769 [Paucilactobacillus suebicus DSM 5007 = KCTC 3549]|uniref:Uncharacterized protein n=1 Tax=Paucilactobacillus suebicus DSM 5007 = KCTC 3549 TaxID=1423807 RepID=A0A0R1W0Y5_9LACO|nr:hypothetical protein FD16_GL001769 [Paucilactobacillus suebicus DSM 5007 = KCTC 3549]